jgi:hypothetical protein
LPKVSWWLALVVHALGQSMDAGANFFGGATCRTYVRV